MNNDMQREMENYRRELARDDPAALERIHLDAKLAMGISHPEVLSWDELQLLERIEKEDPERYRNLKLVAEVSQPPQQQREHCNRLVPIAHAAVGYAIAALLIWWLGIDKWWTWVIAAFPFFYGSSNLKSGLLDSQAELDRKLHGN